MTFEAASKLDSFSLKKLFPPIPFLFRYESRASFASLSSGMGVLYLGSGLCPEIPAMPDAAPPIFLGFWNRLLTFSYVSGFFPLTRILLTDCLKEPLFGCVSLLPIGGLIGGLSV